VAVAEPALAPESAPIERAARPIAWELFMSMRPRQWTKNLLVFAGVVFAHVAGNVRDDLRSLAAFVIFCGLAGSQYVLNDVADAEADRLHPKKRLRPIASGRVSRRVGVTFGLVVLAASLGASVALGPWFLLNAAAYLALSVAYTYWLKHVVLVDVLTIAVGFVLRATAGSAAVRVDVSPWLLVVSILLALFLALAKRRQELVTLSDASAHRRSLEEYSERLLDQLLSMMGMGTILAYSLYTIEAQTQTGVSSRWLKATIPFVIYGMFRYLYLIYEKGKGGSPEEVLLTDRPLQINMVLWGLAVLAILYLR
jgi:4-hydroxybenzoate polyprenyltransferase